jgi:phosphohistidine swiveling domain-containing protein
MTDTTFQPPGAGQWTAESAHAYGAMTPIGQHLMRTGMTTGMAQTFSEYGLPAETLDCRFVHGHMYTRIRPLVSPDRTSTRPPPKALLRLAFRVHPELRRRARKAERALATQPWREPVRQWYERERGQIESENLALQRVALGPLDDIALAAHWSAVLGHAERLWTRHFVLHGYDLGPIGLLLVAGEDWGLKPEEMLPALQGASPSTSEPARTLALLRAEIGRTGRSPASLDDVRAASPAAAAELDRYLELRGWHLVSRYDVDGLTLGEMPAVVLASIVEGSDVAAGIDAEAVAAGLRARVPATEQDEFDDLLAEARLAMDLRDENGPLTVEWTGGLLRRALLEIGARLQARGLLEAAEHVVELGPAEVAPLLTKGDGPTAGTLAARATQRRADSALDLPHLLGPPEPPPPADALPEATARLLRVVQAVLELLDRQDRPHGLAGTGVGTATYRGRARRAQAPEDAIATLEAGDVLVVPYTTPAYNTVLPLAGAVVTAEGGPLSHAAVLARELGIPAVVGVTGALTIPDGATVEVDPTAGEVRILTN